MSIEGSRMRFVAWLPENSPRPFVILTAPDRTAAISAARAIASVVRVEPMPPQGEHNQPTRLERKEETR